MVTHDHSLAWTEQRRFRGALDDVIIIPLVVVALAANKTLRFILTILMRLLDYAFPFAMQIIWLPLFAARLVRQCHRDRHKRCAALPPHIRDETSKVASMDPPELGVAPEQDQLSDVRTCCVRRI